MGALCGPGADAPDQNGPGTIQEKKKLQVYGNSFDADTRTICTLLESANKPYEFIEVNTLLGQHTD